MPRQISEKLTRKELIDPQLERAGWYLRDHSKVKIEIPVDGYDAEPWNGVSDYCLYRENGEVLAVVEAKRTSADVRLAEAQLTYYITEIEKHQSFRPFGFLATRRFGKPALRPPECKAADASRYSFSYSEEKCKIRLR
jgi:type I restriction enzyme, R subunit